MAPRYWSRRECMASAGVALSAGVAGCSSESGDDSSAEGDEGDNADSESESSETEDSIPEPISEVYEGTGDDTATIDVGLMGPTAFSMEHSGPSNFAVEIYNNDGEQVDLLANTIGGYGGVNLANLALESYTLDITADGEWSTEVTQFPKYNGDEIATDWPVELDGVGDGYSGPIDFSDARTISVTASGDGNNILMIRNSFGALADLPVNEIGAYEGSGVVSIPDNVGWIDLEMSGEFKFVLEE